MGYSPYGYRVGHDKQLALTHRFHFQRENIYTGNKHYLPEELVSRPVKQFFYFLISVRKELPEGRLKKARVI